MSFRRRPNKGNLRSSKSFDPAVLNNNFNLKKAEDSARSLASDHSEKTFRTARIQRSWSRDVHSGTTSSPIKKPPRTLRGKLTRAHTMGGETSERFGGSQRLSGSQRTWSSRDVASNPGLHRTWTSSGNEPVVPQRASLTKELSGSLHKTEDCFWTSPTVVVTVLFLAMAVVRSNTKFLLPAMVLFLAKAAIRIAKWIAFVAKNEDLKEVVEITKGYIELLWGHVVVFIDKKQGGSRIARFSKKVTTGMVVHFHQTQYFVMSKYMEKRQKRATKV